MTDEARKRKIKQLLEGVNILTKRDILEELEKTLNEGKQTQELKPNQQKTFEEELEQLNEEFSTDGPLISDINGKGVTTRKYPIDTEILYQIVSLHNQSLNNVYRKCKKKGFTIIDNEVGGDPSKVFPRLVVNMEDLAQAVKEEKGLE